MDLKFRFFEFLESLLGSELSDCVFITKIKSILLSNLLLSGLYHSVIAAITEDVSLIDNLSAKSVFTIDLDGFERKK